MIQIEVTRVVSKRVEVAGPAVIGIEVRRHCNIDLTCQADVVDFRFPLACCVREQGPTAAKIVVSIG
jgi:hypothetical protein